MVATPELQNTLKMISKNDLFKNLSSHPDFIKDTKSAFGIKFQKIMNLCGLHSAVESSRLTDADYLNEEKTQQKDGCCLDGESVFCS